MTESTYDWTRFSKQIFIDADEFYMNDRDHEAGYFLRQLKTELNVGSINFVEKHLEPKTLNVEVIGCAQNTGQVKVASTLLAKMSKEEVAQSMLL